MKHIVITGSTRGIGLGLADAFLKLGCAVTLSGRVPANVDAAIDQLAAQHDRHNMLGVTCDVRNYAEVKALWDAARARFEHVDVWINNAGFSGMQMLIWQMPPHDAQAIVETNLLGTINGAKVAIEGMLQQGYGSLYNMEGAGSDGRQHDRLALYGMTKYAIHYFTDSLILETKGTPLIVGALKPGMVMTDMVVRQFDDRPVERARARRVFNIIADRVETVAPWLAQQILANDKTGVRINWLTKRKLFTRFLLAAFRQRDVFPLP
jgi:NAD(P)-dependent dehydrogenase (short-subunit alcohol dehydrogenase family)